MRYIDRYRVARDTHDSHASPRGGGFPLRVTPRLEQGLASPQQDQHRAHLAAVHVHRRQGHWADVQRLVGWQALYDHAAAQLDADTSQGGGEGEDEFEGNGKGWGRGRAR
eukprot:scaffold80163_cov35-Phaeocystis_antarctica.AAC.1